MSDVTDITKNYMLYFMIPVWIVTGLADYLCHRKTNIETTSGLREAVLHYMMITIMGIPILLALALEINALLILLMFAAYVVHLAMALYDVSYAVKWREVTTIEQHVHSFLEVLPFMAVSFAICLHWEQFLSLFGAGTEPARFILEWKHTPLPASYLVSIMSVVFVFLVLPYSEEIWRCYRVARKA